MWQATYLRLFRGGDWPVQANDPQYSDKSRCKKHESNRTAVIMCGEGQQAGEWAWGIVSKGFKKALQRQTAKG